MRSDNGREACAIAGGAQVASDLGFRPLLLFTLLFLCQITCVVSYARGSQLGTPDRTACGTIETTTLCTPLHQTTDGMNLEGLFFIVISLFLSPSSRLHLHPLAGERSVGPSKQCEDA